MEVNQIKVWTVKYYKQFSKWTCFYTWIIEIYELYLHSQYNKGNSWNE